MPHQNNLRKGRFSQAGNYYHITFRVHSNREHLTFNQKCTIAKTLNHIKYQSYFEFTAWAIMPDHIHRLFQLKGVKTLSELFSLLKFQSALAVNKICGAKEALWQEGFHDHAIRSDESLINVPRYIVANPLRAGVVNSIGDYPFWD